MKALLRLLCAGLLCPALSTFAEVRTFTDSASGRTLSAEVVGASETEVTLKLTTGARHTLPLSRLAEADRTYVSVWLSKNPQETQKPAAAAVTPVGDVRYAFSVSWQKEKTGEKPAPRDFFPYVGEIEEYVCKFKITNLSNVPLEDIEVRYQLHLALERGGRTTTPEVLTGTDKITSLARNVPSEISAKPVPLIKVKLDSGYITADRSRPTKRDSFRGVGVGLFHKGVLVHEFRTAGIPVVPFTNAPADKGTTSP